MIYHSFLMEGHRSGSAPDCGLCVCCVYACCMQMRCEFDGKSRNLGRFGTRRSKFTKSDQNAEFQVLCEKGMSVQKVREF